MLAGQDDRAVAVLAQHEIADGLGERLVAQGFATLAVHGDGADIGHRPAERAGVGDDGSENGRKRGSQSAGPAGAALASAAAAAPQPAAMAAANTRRMLEELAASSTASSAATKASAAKDGPPKASAAAKPSRPATEAIWAVSERSAARQRENGGHRREQAGEGRALPERRRRDGQQPYRRSNHEDGRQPEADGDEGLEPRALDGAGRRLSNRKLRDTLLDDGNYAHAHPLGEGLASFSPAANVAEAP